MSAFFRQSEHTAKFAECIKKLQQKSEELRRIATQCLTKVTIETNDRVKNEVATKEQVNDLGRVFQGHTQFLVDEFRNAQCKTDCPLTVIQD